MSLLKKFGSRKDTRDYVVVSVGGSLIVPDGIDAAFLKSFRAFVLDHLERGLSFFIITGGGRLARNYQDAARDVRGEDGLELEDADWLGIHSTRLNAHLMRSLFLEQAQSRIVKSYDHRIRSRGDIIIGAGWKPGRSTDYCAVIAARELGAKKMVNLSNIDYVYTADPKKDPNATKIETIGWSDFRKLIPEEWDPGLSSPFDPVAAREAESLKLEVAIINGNKLDEFGNYLAGEKFQGTVIH
jgi:uridylate kinase